MNRWFYPFLAVLMLILLPLALAGVEEEEFYCDEETLCDDVCDLYEVECVCQDNICVGAGTEDTGAGGSAAETTPASQPPVEGTDTFEESEEVMTEQSSEGTTASEDTTTNLENRVATVETDVGALKTSVQTLEQDVKYLTEQQKKVPSIEQEVNKISTGQAGLQQDVQEVEKGLEEEQSFTTILKVALIFLIIVIIALGLVYYMTKGKAKPSQRKVNPQIVDYITQSIKAGKKYDLIKRNLLSAGWAAEDIDWAYQQTTAQNYQKYAQQQGTAEQDVAPRKSPPLHAHQSKILVITMVSLVIVIGLIFLLKGVTTGKAIHFQTAGELNTAVKAALNEKITQNEFYPVMEKGNICVQVVEGENTISYQIIKTKKGHTIRPAKRNCDATDTYDFAAKFTSWNAFDFFSTTFTCEAARQLHTRGVYVLPSTYVLQGFLADPELDYSDFCPMISKCLTAEELQKVGIQC